jgi:hypothetical protein
MSYVTVTPACGRDYNSAKAAKAGWNAGEDFILQDFGNPYDGKPINRTQADAEGYSVNLRFGKLRKVTPAGPKPKPEPKPEPYAPSTFGAVLAHKHNR